MPISILLVFNLVADQARLKKRAQALSQVGSDTQGKPMINVVKSLRKHMQNMALKYFP